MFNNNTEAVVEVISDCSSKIVLSLSSINLYIYTRIVGNNNNVTHLRTIDWKANVCGQRGEVPLADSI